jgi:hypothetical protein
MKHEWITIRHVDVNERVTDVVHCVNCGVCAVSTNVDINSPIPRGISGIDGDDCGKRIVNDIMTK